MFHFLDILETKQITGGILDISSYHSINQKILSDIKKKINFAIFLGIKCDVNQAMNINKPFCKNLCKCNWSEGTVTPHFHSTYQCGFCQSISNWNEIHKWQKTAPFLLKCIGRICTLGKMKVHTFMAVDCANAFQCKWRCFLSFVDFCSIPIEMH